MTLFCLQLVAKGHVKFNQKLRATNLVCHCSRQYLLLANKNCNKCLFTVKCISL